MQLYADDLRDNVMMYEGISEEEREEAVERCDAEMVVVVIEDAFLVHDFNEYGLCPNSGYAWDFFVGRGRGWAGWESGGSSSWRILASRVTGLDF
jgi:hypothetical protein